MEKLMYKFFLCHNRLILLNIQTLMKLYDMTVNLLSKFSRYGNESKDNPGIIGNFWEIMGIALVNQGTPALYK